jgi:methyl-accepting chemotaxis protein
LIFSLLVALSLGVPMAATISAPLREMVNIVNSLVGGDFTRLIKIKGNREVNQLVDGLNHAIESLRNLVANINEQAQILARTGKNMNRSSEKINEISVLISGIAEQITLLALNAAIEAARAGEHGRGFSVVASETGKLADQSKQVAQIISNLIKEMIVRSHHAV